MRKRCRAQPVVPVAILPRRRAPLTRVAALFAALLTTLPMLAGQIPAPSNVVGGLRRARYVGAAFAQGSPATLAAVGPGSPAETIGLRAGAVIISVKGAATADPAAIIAAVGKKRAGDAVTIVVHRGGETLTK